MAHTTKTVTVLLKSCLPVGHVTFLSSWAIPLKNPVNFDPKLFFSFPAIAVTLLFRLFMRGMLPAEFTVLAEFQSVRSILLVFLCRVVSLFTLCTCQCYLYAHNCHLHFNFYASCFNFYSILQVNLKIKQKKKTSSIATLIYHSKKATSTINLIF